MDPRIALDQEKIAEFCRRWQIRELAVFGSAVGGSFRQDSDIDVLVDFEPAAEVGFVALAAMARELTLLFGRQVDLVSKSGLKSAIRDSVLRQAEVLYAA